MKKYDHTKVKAYKAANERCAIYVMHKNIWTETHLPLWRDDLEYRCGEYRSQPCGSLWYVGQDVWTIQNGWATITAIGSGAYSIHVGGYTYTQEGLASELHTNPSLFTHDVLKDTDAPLHYLLGEFYKMRTLETSKWIVAECIGTEGTFKSHNDCLNLKDVRDIIMMQEVTCTAH